MILAHVAGMMIMVMMIVMMMMMMIMRGWEARVLATEARVAGRRVAGRCARRYITI